MQPFAAELVRIAGANGLVPRVTSTLRTTAQQTRLYRAYLAGTQKYPVAPPGTSSHEYGWSFDMVVSDLSYLPDLGGVWEGWGGTWGGEFSDPIHFEWPGFKAALKAAGLGGQAVFTPNWYDKTVNFLYSFIPGVGEAQIVAAGIGILYPNAKETTVYKLIQDPVIYSEILAAGSQASYQ